MLHIDVISAYAICGAGSLVGVAMMLLADVDDDDLRRAVRLFAWGFACVGAGLFQLGYAVDDGAPRQLSVLVATDASLVGIVLFHAAFARLRGAVPWRGTAAGGAMLAVAVAVAWRFWPSREFAMAFNLAQLAVTATIVWGERQHLLGRCSVTERVVAWSVALFGLTWVLRLAATAVYVGPPLFHIAYVPAQVMPYLGVFYGVIPVIIAALVLNVVTGRLATRLRALAHTDDLTGAQTRHGLRALAPAVLAREHGEGRRVATLMIDIDHFKGVNDRHGHGGGDEVLRRAAALLRSHLRRDAVVTRYGGEEFMVLMPVADLVEARAAAERLRAAFESATHAIGVEAVRVTISAGVALVEPGELLEATLARADAALYRAKRGGRNRIETALAQAPARAAAFSAAAPACAGPSR